MTWSLPSLSTVARSACRSQVVAFRGSCWICLGTALIWTCSQQLLVSGLSPTKRVGRCAVGDLTHQAACTDL